METEPFYLAICTGVAHHAAQGNLAAMTVLRQSSLFGNEPDNYAVLFTYETSVECLEGMNRAAVKELIAKFGYTDVWQGAHIQRVKRNGEAY